jgi:hypothetical protein
MAIVSESRSQLSSRGLEVTAARIGTRRPMRAPRYRDASKDAVTQKPRSASDNSSAVLCSSAIAFASLSPTTPITAPTTKKMPPPTAIRNCKSRLNTNFAG